MRLIDADELLKFPIRADHCDEENANEHFINGVETVMEYAKNLPTVDAEPVRHGKWIIEHEPFTWMGYTQWHCSCCGFTCSYGQEIRSRTNFCPNCGARMDGEV